MQIFFFSRTRRKQNKSILHKTFVVVSFSQQTRFCMVPQNKEETPFCANYTGLRLISPADRGTLMKHDEATYPIKMGYLLDSGNEFFPKAEA